MQIQLDLQKDLDKKLKLYSVENDFNDKRLAIIDILKKFFEGKK